MNLFGLSFILYFFKLSYGSNIYKQRTKVDSAFSSWELLLSGFPQGSIPGRLLFNIYVCDKFFGTPENTDFAGYADDNTL